MKQSTATGKNDVMPVTSGMPRAACLVTCEAYLINQGARRASIAEGEPYHDVFIVCTFFETYR